MTELTSESIVATANKMAVDYLDTIAALGLSPNDTANLTSAFAAQVLGMQMGPVGAVERLRDVADLLERELLDQRTLN